MSRIVLDREAVRQLMLSDEMLEICKEFAEDIRQKTGSPDGYIVTGFKGKTRCNASVITIEDSARLDNLENNTLIKAVSK